MLSYNKTYGSYTSAATAAAVAIPQGHYPDYFEMWVETSTAADIVHYLWMSSMGTGKGIKNTVLADNGATGNKNEEWIASGGVAPYKVAMLPDKWKTGTAYVIGNIVRPKTTQTGYYYVCVVAGTSHAATEPTWPTTVGTLSASDNGVYWQCANLGEQGIVVPAGLQKNSTKFHYQAMSLTPT